MRQAQRPRGSLTRLAIVDAALSLVDEVGVPALSIRAVARRVGVAPMSLYTHFRGKEALLDALYEEVTRRLFADSGQATWQAECDALCHQVRRGVLEHPHWVSLLARPAAAPPRLPLRERLLTLMTSDGMPVDRAFSAISTLGLLSMGAAMVELTLRSSHAESNLRQRFELLERDAESDDFGSAETLSNVALKQLRGFDMDSGFSAATRIFIAGLEAQPRQASLSDHDVTPRDNTKQPTRAG
jgi:AcrR family transcriptional regulator